MQIQDFSNLLRSSAPASTCTSCGIMGYRSNIFNSSNLESASSDSPNCCLSSRPGSSRTRPPNRTDFDMHRCYSFVSCNFGCSCSTFHCCVRRRFESISFHMASAGTERYCFRTREISHVHYCVIVTTVNVNNCPSFLLLCIFHLNHFVSYALG